MNQQKAPTEKEHIIDSLKMQQQDALQRVKKKKVQESKPFLYWLEKNHYYYYRLKKFYRFAVPEGMRVLSLQCKNGYLLDAVKPSYGVGVDTDLAMITEAKETYARHHFHHGTLADLQERLPFDYILLSEVMADVYDAQSLFESLKPFCHAGTRIIVDTHAYMWQPLLWCAQRLGLSRTLVGKTWLTQEDVQNFLYLSGYQVVEQSNFLLLPVYLPFISTLCNAVLAHVPLLKRLCLHRAVIARPLFIKRDTQEYTVSVIIPCKNEKGNIESAVKRTPQMGKFTELIFVCGNSVDGTLDEIKRVAQKYPERSVSIYKQKETGKGDAVRMGFDYAIGDIVMILDADLTMPPEELPKFYYALIENKGECLNGSRLVYKMERQAMRPLNYVANRFFSKLFSWLLGQRVKDTLCGTKVLWKEDYQLIARNRAEFGNFDPFGDFDLLFGAAKLHLKLLDIPVHYKNRRYGSSQIRRFYCGWILLGMSLLAMKKFKFK
jgi:2-polyprenyl-3-methyl-5-hydroxy-6-metoxy-1,4-benzoquinol methylase